MRVDARLEYGDCLKELRLPNLMFNKVNLTELYIRETMVCAVLISNYLA